MIEGEIFKLKDEYKKHYTKNFYNHHFIFWDDEGGDIRGIMLTKSDKRKWKNIRLKDEHFKPGFKIKNENSHIAPLYLLKEINYEHLKKTGELSGEGIDFIQNIIPQLKHTDWGTYERSKFKL